MDVAGSAFPIAPLLTTCSHIVTILHNVGKKFKRAPLMMTSIATECSLIHVALAQLRTFDWSAVIANAEGRQEQLTRATEAIILGCTLTLSVIEEYAVELQEYVDGAPLSPTEQMGIMARVRVLWKEDEMRELLLQLRGYQTGLTGLIRAAHDTDLNGDDGDAIGNTANYATLLQRSRSSRARKPLSIRSAMQQAATYTSIAQPSNTASTTSLASAATAQSRQSTASSSAVTTSSVSSKNRDADGDPALHESHASAPASKKGSADAATSAKRVKRPAFLSLAPEESDSVKDGQSIITKRSKDQMRKSSPTVGDKFEYVPGMPPPPSLPTSLPTSDSASRDATSGSGSRDSLSAQTDEDAKKAKRPSKDSFHEPPASSPPRVPLPEPPTDSGSRSPSRSRSPAPKSPMRSILRNPSNTDLPASATAHRRQGSASPPKTDQTQQDAPVGGDDEPAKAAASTPPQVDPSRFPAPRSDSLPSPRKQRSNSSVRDQIMVLPETARLRKQASNELLRRKTSAELLGQSGLHEAVPAIPPQSQDRVVVGNAFGRRGSNPSAPQGVVPRTSSFDMLTDAGRKRSGTDTAQQTTSTQDRIQTQLPLNQRRGPQLQRSASDARRPSNLKHLSADTKSDESMSQASDSVQSPSTIPTSPSQTSQSTAPLADAWPLNQRPGFHGELSQHQSHYGSRHQLHSAERAFARSPTFERRSLSPESAPRISRSVTPYTSTSGQRSRTNTLMTIESEVGELDKHTLGEGSSGYGSGVPSVLSSQWYQSPQDRLNMGPRVSMADSIPWELGDEDEGEDDDANEEQFTRFHPTPRLGTSSETVRVPARSNFDSRPQSPPRSPLLTDGFLVNVKSGLPRDDLSARRMLPPPSEAPSTRPSTSMNSYSTSSGSSSSKNKKEKEKKKKEKKSTKTTMRDLWNMYKESTNTVYTTTYQRAAEEQRVDAEKRSLTNSSSTSGSTRVHSSMDGQIPTSSKGSKISPYGKG
ncbi:uncharacterized protein PV09_08235 [Verruconis gallopava]|uniref:Uncharacterized protein n=1 Tax=Verruconis gallopava TaxID=253628 RepID=A0A0D2A1I8_9PEZI|nr:uncharacterized protein PV09_08235 [Verruconis gallopava]KIW00195.1 hypothetical protein PV09_08235 [Verruconis gallopava]